MTAADMLKLHPLGLVLFITTYFQPSCCYIPNHNFVVSTSFCRIINLIVPSWIFRTTVLAHVDFNLVGDLI